MEKFIKISEELTFIMSSIFCAETNCSPTAPSLTISPFQNPAQTLSTSLTGAASRHILQTPVNFALRQQSFAYPIP